MLLDMMRFCGLRIVIMNNTSIKCLTKISMCATIEVRLDKSPSILMESY